MLNISPDEFNDYFNKAITFADYLGSIQDTEEEDHAKRTRLNFKRAKIPAETMDRLNSLNYPIKLLIIAASWCWDCQTSLPVIARMAESEKIDLRLLMKDKYPNLVHKINGGEKIPQVHFYSNDGYYVTSWVEKPAMAYRIQGEVRKELGWNADKKEFVKSYRKAFMQNSAAIREEVIKELMMIIDKIQAIFSTSPRMNKGK